MTSSPRETAPVAVIIYRRPQLTERVLSRVFEAGPSRLFVIADGPEDLPSERKIVEATRAVVEKFPWSCEVTRFYSDENLGLRERVLSGLDAVFDVEPSAIILEDDCLPSASFFEFASEALIHFQEDSRISLVSGSNPNGPAVDAQFWLSYSSPIWGWATWRRQWASFRNLSKGQSWSEGETAQILETFFTSLSRKRFARFMESSAKLDSWAIEFSAFNRLQKQFSLVSGENLVENIGFGSGSTHTKFESFVDQAPAREIIDFSFPETIEYDPKNDRRMDRNRYLKWVSYPVQHPFDSLMRILRFLRS